MWRSKNRQNDLGKRDLGLWSNLQGVTFPAAGAEPRERWTNSRGGLIDRNWNWWKISCFWWRNIKCLAKFGILEYDFRRTSCFENCKKQSIKSIWIILVLIFIHAKNVWCCGEGYFGQKKIAEKVRKSRQNVNRDKSA